ncbi:MAG: mycofactocin biosynthesis peptidyl-dipeptidase MftE [Acidimicrobiales bacterium]
MTEPRPRPPTTETESTSTSTSTSTTTRFGRWTSSEAAAARAEHPVLLVPLGATEQHGPHLPLDTDSVIAERWALALADRRSGVVVAPTLPYGSSGEHQDFAGTLSIGQDALELVVIELARSAATTFETVVFVSGHAGNLDPLRRAISRLRAEGHDTHLLLPVVAGSDAHAGRTETALMLHLDPEAVRADRAEPGNTEPLGAIIDRLRSGGVAAVSPNGVLGDPTGASDQEGSRILGDLAAMWPLS